MKSRATGMNEPLFERIDVPGGHLERDPKHNVFHGYVAELDGDRYLGVFDNQSRAQLEVEKQSK